VGEKRYDENHEEYWHDDHNDQSILECCSETLETGKTYTQKKKKQREREREIALAKTKVAPQTGWMR
jgi:hypothetical protein